MALDTLRSAGESLDLTVDIVAIHGLNGDPTRTWTTSKGAFWLKDFLPLDVPGARVMNFGYNATAAFGNSIADFEDHARSLLTSLDDARQRANEKRRPLIFVAHSLGGIIVKQALLLAKADHKYECISTHTIGIVFLGTPHRGSDIAAYGNALAKIATLVTNKPKPSLIESLKENSAELLKLESEFKSELSKYMVASFYERRSMGVGRLSTVIVDKDSALLGFEGEDRVPVDADHRDICKFASREDPTYSKIFHRIKRMLDASKAQAFEDVEGTSGDSGWTPLHRAARDGVSAELRRLLRQGADINADDNIGMTPLHHASAAGHDTVAFILLGRGAKVRQDDVGRTALHCAAENGHMAVVRELLVHGVEVGTKDRSGRTAMNYALERQHEAVVWLFENGPELTAKDSNGDTIVLWAAKKGLEAVVQLFLGMGAEVTARGEKDRATALHHAADQGNKTIVQMLLKIGAEIDAQDRYKATALHSAAASGHLPVVRLLVDEGADIDVADSLGRTPVNLAVSFGHGTTAQLLKAAQQGDLPEVKGHSLPATGAIGIPTRTAYSPNREPGFSRASTAVDLEDRSPSGEKLSPGFRPSLEYKRGRTARTSPKQLFQAVKAGNYKIVEELVGDSEVDLNSTDGHGATALHMASDRADEAIVRLLTEAGASVSATDRSGATPLHIASRGGHEEVAWVLLDANADVKAKTLNKQTALHLASQYGNEATVKLLFEYGASLDAKDKNGWTAIALAASHGNEDAVRFLVANNADLDLSENGETVLHVAAQSGHEKVICALLESEISINKQTKAGLTALHIASSRGMEAAVRVLLEKGAASSATTALGFTALHLAAESGHELVTRLLVESNAAIIETPCRDLGATALHYAAMSPNEEVVRMLLDSGADLGSRCKEKGATPLHYAAFHGREATVRLLLERGADVMALSNSKKPASHWANRPEHREVVQLLKEKEKEQKQKEKVGRHWMGFGRRSPKK
ncbi:MAG: hypothetical protein M1839_000009 [Geoglossum umbratile]|nr:MAG: hypothetical protein M1839_000009 [Geoglossum umbratile]